MLAPPQGAPHTSPASAAQRTVITLSCKSIRQDFGHTSPYPVLIWLITPSPGEMRSTAGSLGLPG